MSDEPFPDVDATVAPTEAPAGAFPREATGRPDTGERTANDGSASATELGTNDCVDPNYCLAPNDRADSDDHAGPNNPAAGE